MNISVGQNWLNKKKPSWVFSSSLPTKVGVGTKKKKAYSYFDEVLPAYRVG